MMGLTNMTPILLGYRGRIRSGVGLGCGHKLGTFLNKDILSFLGHQIPCFVGDLEVIAELVVVMDCLQEVAEIIVVFSILFDWG